MINSTEWYTCSLLILIDLYFKIKITFKQQTLSLYFFFNSSNGFILPPSCKIHYVDMQNSYMLGCNLLFFSTCEIVMLTCTLLKIIFIENELFTYQLQYLISYTQGGFLHQSSNADFCFLHWLIKVMSICSKNNFKSITIKFNKYIFMKIYFK